MLDGLPGRLLHEGDQRDGDIGEHEDGESEHVADLLGRRGANGVPLHEGGEHAEHEHEHKIVAQAEHHRGNRAGNGNAGGHDAGSGQYDNDGVEQNGDDGQQHARGNGHEHIVASEAVAAGVGDRALHQTAGVVGEHLVEALGPTEALVPRVAEGDGLLVVEHRRGAVGDAHPVDDGGGGELDVLGEQVPLPAAGLLQDVGRDEEPGARHGAGGVQGQARLVEELGLAQEPHAVAGRDPVAPEVLGIAIGGGGLGTRIEGGVHLAEVVHVQHVVGVEDEVGLVVLVGILLPDGLQAPVEGVALPHLLVVVARKHNGAGLAGHLGRAVGAVIGDDEHIDELGGVVLHLDGMDEIGDDCLLVARSHHDSVAVVARSRLLRGATGENDQHVVELIGVAQGKGQEHAEVEDVNEGQRRHLRSYGIEHQCTPWTCAEAGAYAQTLEL